MQNIESLLDEIALRAARFAVEEYESRHRERKILSTEQLKDHFDWSDSTVRRKIAEGMPCLGAKGERKRFVLSEVEKWLSGSV